MAHLVVPRIGTTFLPRILLSASLVPVSATFREVTALTVIVHPVIGLANSGVKKTILGCCFPGQFLSFSLRFLTMGVPVRSALVKKITVRSYPLC